MIDNIPENTTHYDPVNENYWDLLNGKLWNHNGFWFDYDIQ